MIVDSTTIERNLFSGGNHGDVYQYLSTSEETKNLIEVLNYKGFENYVKKDASMLLLQMLVVNYFSNVHEWYHPQKNWYIPADYKLKSFLQDTYRVYSSYPEVFSKKPENTFLTVQNLTPVGYKVLEKSNFFFTELYKDIIVTFKYQDTPDFWKVFVTEKESIMNKYYQIFIEILKILFKEGYPEEASSYPDLFSPYSNVDGYEDDYDKSISWHRMNLFINNLLIFSYTCNGGWVIPRQRKKGLKESNFNADILRILYNSEQIYHPSSKSTLQRIERALPKIANKLLQSKNTEIVSNKVSYKYPIPEGFREAHSEYYNKKITMYEFSNMFHVSDTKIREWMKECNLPVRPRGVKKDKSFLDVWNEQEPQAPKYLKKDFTPTVISVEPQVQVLPMEEPTFKFSLFGYEFSFKAKKKELPKSVDLSDEFPDEVEY